MYVGEGGRWQETLCLACLLRCAASLNCVNVENFSCFRKRKVQTICLCDVLMVALRQSKACTHTCRCGQWFFPVYVERRSSR